MDKNSLRKKGGSVMRNYTVKYWSTNDNYIVKHSNTHFVTHYNIVEKYEFGFLRNILAILLVTKFVRENMLNRGQLR